MVEAIIALVCLIVILTAIIETAIWSVRMSISGQRNLDIYTFASSWFHALSAVPPNIVASGPNAAMPQAARLMGSNRSMDINGYKVAAVFVGPNQGVVRVKATFSRQGTDAVVMERNVFVGQ